MYYAIIKTHPTKEVWSLYSDSNNIVITLSSAKQLRQQVLAAYGKSEIKILQYIKFVDQPSERIN